MSKSVWPFVAVQREGKLFVISIRATRGEVTLGDTDGAVTLTYKIHTGSSIRMLTYMADMIVDLNDGIVTKSRTTHVPIVTAAQMKRRDKRVISVFCLKHGRGVKHCVLEKGHNGPCDGPPTKGKS